MIAVMNDLMDSLYGDIKLTGQGLHRLASGIPNMDEHITFFLGRARAKSGKSIENKGDGAIRPSIKVTTSGNDGSKAA